MFWEKGMNTTNKHIHTHRYFDRSCVSLRIKTYILQKNNTSIYIPKKRTEFSRAAYLYLFNCWRIGGTVVSTGCCCGVGIPGK